MARPSAFSSGFSQGFGLGPYHYCLSPLLWDTSSPLDPHWRAPASTVGAVDIRPLPAQAAAGGAAQGFAFAATLAPVDGVEIAACPHLSDEAATAGMCDAWQAATGFRPAGAKLVDLLWDQLTTGADPEGLDGPRPLVPSAAGVLNLHLRGHSLVKSERFVWGVHPHTNRLRDLLRQGFEAQWEASGGSDHCRRVLDATCEKYRVADWREFVPARLHPHVPGRLPHATTITDNFNRANANPISASGEGWSWVSITGEGQIVSNYATAAASGGSQEGRAASDLSSSDNYAQCVVAVGGGANSFVGPLCRKESGTATRTFYNTAFSATTTQLLRKRVTGTSTTLQTDTVSSTRPSTSKVQASGSDIEHFENGVSLGVTTDTAIAAGVQTGLQWGFGPASTDQIEDFEAADLGGGGGGPAIPIVMHHRRLMGVS